MPLFINQNGRVACTLPRHGGSYLASAVEHRPKAQTIDTPLDNWERLTEDDVREGGISCEDC